MCSTSEAGFGSVAEALRMGIAFADYLNSPTAADLEPAALGEVLVSLGEIQSKLAVAHAEFLCRFDAHDAHDADGYSSSTAWLAAKAKLGKKDAKATVRRMQVLSRHPLLTRGIAQGEISESWAREIVGWLGKLPEELREGTEKILAEAAGAGASLDDLATITAAALAQWETDHPDEDDEGTFPDRFLQVETTLDGAAVIRGDLTPECAAAVTAVLEALGKKAGPEDDRSTPQRFHDALQLACELLLRAKLVPDREQVDRLSADATQAWHALRYDLARLAINMVSGPAGVASILRRGLLEHPWNTPSLPLDVGYADSIPASIRRAVNWRDRYKCAWPRCGRPAAQCDVHHIKHKKDGGKTSVDSCITLCNFHHDVCVHRWGWRIVLNPDGTVSVYGPDGQAQHSHSPPTIGAG